MSAAIRTATTKWLVKYAEGTQTDFAPVTRPRGQSPNLWLRYRCEELFRAMERNDGPTIWDLHGQLEHFYEEMIRDHLYKREDFSSIYGPCWKACAYMLIEFGPGLEELCERWLDISHSAEALCYSPNRRSILGPPSATNDKLVRGPLINPPCQRDKGGHEGRKRQWNSTIWAIEAGEDYQVKWTKGGPGSNPERFAWIVKTLERRGRLYKPESSLRLAREARLAMPFNYRSAERAWVARAALPIPEPNVNNKRIEVTAGGASGIIGTYIIGAPDPLRPAPQPPPVDQPDTKPDIPEVAPAHASVPVAALKMREGQLRDLADAPHTRAPTRALARDIADAMKRWREGT